MRPGKFSRPACAMNGASAGRRPGRRGASTAMLARVRCRVGRRSPRHGPPICAWTMACSRVVSAQPLERPPGRRATQSARWQRRRQALKAAVTAWASWLQNVRPSHGSACPVEVSLGWSMQASGFSGARSPGPGEADVAHRPASFRGRGRDWAGAGPLPAPCRSAPCGPPACRCGQPLLDGLEASSARACTEFHARIRLRLGLVQHRLEHAPAPGNHHEGGDVD